MTVRAHLLTSLVVLGFLDRDCESHAEAEHYAAAIIDKILAHPGVVDEYGSERLLPYSARAKALENLRESYPKRFNPTYDDRIPLRLSVADANMRLRAGRDLVMAVAEMAAGTPVTENSLIDKRGRILLSSTRLRLRCPPDQFNRLIVLGQPHQGIQCLEMSLQSCAWDHAVSFCLAADVSYGEVRRHAKQEVVRRHYRSTTQFWLAWNHPALGRMTVLDEREFHDAIKQQWDMADPENPDRTVFNFWVETI